MIAIIDYGVGNLFSLSGSFAAIGEETVVTGDPAVIRTADRLVLPGVGAFKDAAAKLTESGLAEVVRSEALNGKPLLGICLGMQLLFEGSMEDGWHPGLSLLQGTVQPIREMISPELKVPHIGWNALLPAGRYTQLSDCPLFTGLSEGEYVYFVHSFAAADCEDSLAAVTEYGAPLTAAVLRNHIAGCQFHPEKSGKAGLQILKNFASAFIS